MGDTRCTYGGGGGAWNPSYSGGGGAWNHSYGGSGGGGAWNPSYGGSSHGICGKASYDPAAMAPSYGPHRLHLAARHRSTPYDPSADARPRLAPIPPKGPHADLFWMDHYYGQDWDDGDDDDDDGDIEPPICEICNTESDHITMACPFIVLTSQLDVFRNPPKEVRYYFYRVEDKKTDLGTYGHGFSFYLPPCQRNVEHCAADAMMLHKDGMNLVRITNVPKELTKPEPLYKLFVEIGALTHVVVLPDQALAFVNFVSVEAAQTAIKRFNSSGFGHLMWATRRP